MNTRLRTLVANAALTVFALSVSFGLGEVAVRLLYKDDTVLFPRYHTDYRYGQYWIRGIRPHSNYWMTSVDGSWNMITNSRGFRNDQDFPYDKPAGTTRVIILGDSHTQGYEVRQQATYAAVLERFLNHNGRRAEVINAGVSGFSTAEELVFLENEGVKYHPDAVVLGFFANDFEDNDKAGLFGLDANGQLTEKKYEHLPGVRIQNAIYSLPIVPWLSENSYFYSILFNSVWEYFKARLETSSKAAVAKETSRTPPVTTTEYAVPTSTRVSEHQLALTSALIQRMHRFCRERGIRFIVVDIPAETKQNGYRASLSPALLERLALSGIESIGSLSLLQRFGGAAEVHVPHGNRHISELTHTLIGAELGHRLTGADAQQ
jgi:hypothetical protein